MYNKKKILTLGTLTLILGASVFIAVRMFNREAPPVSADGPNREGQFTFSLSKDIVPAVELPAISPEMTGLFVETKDHTMIIQAVSFDPGIGGILGNSVDVNSAPNVEILMTANTTVYRDTTQGSVSAAGGNAAIQQTVEESTLEELAPPTMITVWGFRSGDRIIADVLLFSNSMNIQKP